MNQRVEVVSTSAGSLATVRARLRNWGRAALELALPRECVGCHTNLGDEFASSGVPICGDCLDDLPLFDGLNCLRCAAILPAALAVRDRCPVCRDTKLWFDEAIALGDYEGLLRNWLLQMKHSAGDGLSLALGELLWGRCEERLRAAAPDVVVPVPSHWRRRWAHATNSAAVVAEVLARRLGIPLAAGLVSRTRNTPPQFSLTPSERPANVRRAFSVRAGYHLQSACVLLVDDILTTGSTCSAVARELKDHGAIRVAVAVVARTISH